MSRIHEALKRAEQERVASQSAHLSRESADRGITTSAIETVAPSSNTFSPEIASPAASPTVVSSQVQTEVLPENLHFEGIWANCSKTQWKPDAHMLVFGNSDPFHPGAEQFRTLRSRLYRIRESQPLQTILISSAIPAEGKTLIATNLAHAMVRQHGCRVLLIDADLRSPRIHTLLGAPATPGLADLLQSGATELEVIQRGHEPGLCFIPAGNHVTHPSELISSDAMKRLLTRLKSAFDWIIIDSPPALPVADASVLGGICDGVLFVVRAKMTPSETSQKACKELRDAHILGVVLNTADEADGYGSYYSNGRYGAPPSAAKKNKE